MTEAEIAKRLLRQQHREQMDEEHRKFCWLADYAAEKAGMSTDDYMEGFWEHYRAGQKEGTNQG